MRSLEMEPTEDDLHKMVKEVDTDGSGEIDFCEFLLMMEKIVKEAEIPEEQVAIYEKAFAEYDRDGDGTMNTEELGVLMRELGQNPSAEELRIMIDNVDADGSGSIEFPEFLQLMKDSLRKDGKIRPSIAGDVSVTVPDSAKPGQFLSVAGPAGRMVDFVVPEGCRPGEIITVPAVMKKRIDIDFMQSGGPETVSMLPSVNLPWDTGKPGSPTGGLLDLVCCGTNQVPRPGNYPIHDHGDVEPARTLR